MENITIQRIVNQILFVFCKDFIYGRYSYILSIIDHSNDSHFSFNLNVYSDVSLVSTTIDIEIYFSYLLFSGIFFYGIHRIHAL